MEKVGAGGGLLRDLATEAAGAAGSTNADGGSGGGESDQREHKDEEDEHLSIEEMRALSDEDLFQAWKDGKVKSMDEKELKRIENNHPLFLTEMPEGPVNPETHPELAMIQDMIMDGKTPEEVAMYEKDSGNEEFADGKKEKDKKKRRKHFHEAIKFYDEALSRKVPNIKLLKC